MSHDECVEALNQLMGDDCESIHSRADQIMLEYLRTITPRIAIAYDLVKKRAPWWAYA